MGLFLLGKLLWGLLPLIYRCVMISNISSFNFTIESKMQLCVSIITCNLLVLATYVYRKVHEGLNETTERTQTPDPSSNGQGRLATPLTVIHSLGRETRGSRPGGVSVERSRPSVPLGSHSTHVTLTELGSSMLDGLDTTFDNGSSGSNYADTRHHSNADPEQISPVPRRRFKLWF